MEVVDVAPTLDNLTTSNIRHHIRHHIRHPSFISDSPQGTQQLVSKHASLL
jgi:hypothetical protein